MFKITKKYIIIALLFLLIDPNSVLAASPTGSLEASPAFIEVELDKPDQTKQIVLTYTNHSREPIALDIFPIDFKQADGTGNISFLGAESGSFSYSLSSFLSFESDSLELEAGEKKDFAISVKNRQDLSPGGHYAAVIAKLKLDEGDIEGQAKVAPSVSSFILLRKVGGERFNLSLTSLDFPGGGLAFNYPQSLTANFQNEGNIHLVPYGTVEINDIFGRMIYKGVINTQSRRIFPETRRDIKVDMQKTAWSLPVSLNTLKVRGNDSLNKVSFSYNGSFLYFNPLFAGSLVVGVIVVLIWVKRNKKK